MVSLVLFIVCSWFSTVFPEFLAVFLAIFWGFVVGFW